MPLNIFGHYQLTQTRDKCVKLKKNIQYNKHCTIGNIQGKIKQNHTTQHLHLNTL